MKTKFYIGLLFVLGFMETAITFIFPVDYQYRAVSFVPHLCLTALFLIVFKRNWLDRILIGFLFGILYDALFQYGFSFHILIYPLLSVLSGIFSDYMDQDNRVLLFNILILMFLYDCIPFFIYKFLGKLSVSFTTWFIYFELSTLLIHIALIAVLIYVFNVFDRYEAIQRIRTQRLEKKKYRNLRLSRK
ncbi:rod shape-determining protein MreD [Floccifex sp.]|uniref:rod shape-determining protein MreD n=1 Tax=Floccifex sp. TaxID=2815810 RepID=UPI002A764434|nr:rod shape-determining protein MreD [Floccifex sp.]MDD7281732.1 rod shape-determining protein MreD [Erysipelotrichaceae bacterium]MDY2957586.1 rod shape-determining protein MreD [Floccifex sp.]